MTDARTALCYLTPAPRRARRGESGPGPCSLEISVQDQLLPPSLGNPLQGLGSLGIRTRRASRDGSASAPTEPRLFTLSTHSDRHVVCSTHRTLRQAAPTSRAGPNSCILGFTPAEPPAMARPRHQLSLGSLHRQRTATSTSSAMPCSKLSLELPRRIGSGVTGALLQCIKDKATPLTMPPQ